MTIVDVIFLIFILFIILYGVQIMTNLANICVRMMIKWERWREGL